MSGCVAIRPRADRMHDKLHDLPAECNRAFPAGREETLDSPQPRRRRALMPMAFSDEVETGSWEGNASRL